MHYKRFSNANLRQQAIECAKKLLDEGYNKIVIETTVGGDFLVHYALVSEAKS